MTNNNTEIKNNVRRVIVLYNILEDNINKGSLVGIAMWSEALLNCMAHIEVDNIRLFKGV